MSQDLRNAIRTILSASADLNELNITIPGLNIADNPDWMFAHMLQNYARAKQESFNFLRFVASSANAHTEQEIRTYFEITAQRVFRRITPEQTAAIYEAIRADEQAVTGS